MSQKHDRMMSIRELEEKGKRYMEAIHSGNYEEALQLNRQIYCSEFIKYRILQKALRLLKKQEPILIVQFNKPAYLEEVRKEEAAIKRMVTGLKNLEEVAIRFEEVLTDEQEDSR